MSHEKVKQFIQTNLKEMGNYTVSLDSDPLANGLATFNKKISEAREYTNRVATILTTAIFIKRNAQATRDRSKSEFERKINLILSSDPRVYETPEGQRSSQELRRANALNVLREDGLSLEEVLDDAEDFLHTANMFYETAKTVYENLNETRKDLLYQISVIRTQIAVGEVATDPLIRKELFQPGILDTEVKTGSVGF